MALRRSSREDWPTFARRGQSLILGMPHRAGRTIRRAVQCPEEWSEEVADLHLTVHHGNADVADFYLWWELV